MPFGARSNAAALSPVRVTSVSVSLMPVTVTLPVFVTFTVYVIVVPAAVISVGFAVFSTFRPGVCVALTCSLSDAVTSLPSGALPFAVAVLSILPAFMSASVAL